MVVPVLGIRCVNLQSYSPSLVAENPTLVMDNWNLICFCFFFSPFIFPFHFFFSLFPHYEKMLENVSRHYQSIRGYGHIGTIAFYPGKKTGNICVFARVYEKALGHAGVFC